jgi:hypothetical protein
VYQSTLCTDMFRSQWLLLGTETVFLKLFRSPGIVLGIDRFRQPMLPELEFLKSLWELGTEEE